MYVCMWMIVDDRCNVSIDSYQQFYRKLTYANRYVTYSIGTDAVKFPVSVLIIRLSVTC